jgi:phosphohistidine phosphatase SixA
MGDSSTRTLLVMRHAEKLGDDDDPHLDPAGLARAQKLVAYIPSAFGTPDAIIAAADSHRSVRPRETVTPLAQLVHLPVLTPYADSQFAELAAKLRNPSAFAQKLIVVCWHHSEIPQLMEALGAPAGSYPPKWDHNVFNLILKTELSADDTVSVTQILEPF